MTDKITQAELILLFGDFIPIEATTVLMDPDLSLTDKRDEIIMIASKTHIWVDSTLGHGETMCEKCFMTNREWDAIGQPECGS